MPTSNSLARNLFIMTWPMLFGVLALMSFQLVDSFFISLLGTQPLAALGFTMPINQLMIAVQIGTGIAATALISRAIGAKQTDYAKRLSGLVLLIGSGLMGTLALLIFFLKQPILLALGADESVFVYTDSYWLPWLVSSWSHAFLYFGNSLCRANGDTRLPGLMMVVTSVLNMLLDPIFIFVFDWGLPGAAYATIVSCVLGSAVMHWRLIKRRWLLFELRQMDIPAAIGSVAKISLPAMLSQLMPGMAAMIATRIVALYGTTAIAAWALGTRLETFSIVIVLALTMSMPPMLGRMLGAGNLDQAHKLIRMAVRFILMLQVVVALFWLLVRPWMVDTLTQEPATAFYLASYMLWVPISYSFLGVCILMVSACNALGMPMRAVLISVLRLFACYLPAVALGAYLAEMEGIYYGVLFGNLIAGISAWLLYRKGFRRLEAKAKAQ
ncbi:MAG: MATE family efflux transporter [Gammaproteobacteria bacterium]|nr:MATE family efflux transporter [Gammaproteobacteria bacterium]